MTAPHDDLKKLATQALENQKLHGNVFTTPIVRVPAERYLELVKLEAALIEENRVLRQVRRIPKTRNRKGWEGMTRDEEDEITDTNRLDWIALRPGIVKILKKGILVAGVNESQPNVRTAIDLAIRMEIKRNQRGSNNG